jgi:hypothetical protein
MLGLQCIPEKKFHTQSQIFPCESAMLFTFYEVKGGRRMLYSVESAAP